MKALFGFVAGVAVTVIVFYCMIPRPTFTSNAQGWKLEHIAIPACRDGFTRSVDIPERDEVDAMTVTCARELPEPSLDLDAQGRTIDYVPVPKRHHAGCWFHHGHGVPDKKLADSACSAR